MKTKKKIASAPRLTEKKKLEAARRELRRIQREIAELGKRRRFRPVTTSGRWGSDKVTVSNEAK